MPQQYSSPPAMSLQKSTKKPTGTSAGSTVIAEREDFEPITLTAYATISFTPKISNR